VVYDSFVFQCTIIQILLLCSKVFHRHIKLHIKYGKKYVFYTLAMFIKAIYRFCFICWSSLLQIRHSSPVRHHPHQLRGSFHQFLHLSTSHPHQGHDAALQHWWNHSHQCQILWMPCGSDLLFWICLFHFMHHHYQELWKVNCPIPINVNFINHIL